MDCLPSVFFHIVSAASEHYWLSPRYQRSKSVIVQLRLHAFLGVTFKFWSGYVEIVFFFLILVVTTRTQWFIGSLLC
jgi:hypothetical protein